MEKFAHFIFGIPGDPEIGQWLVIGLFAAAAFALVVAIYFLVFGIYNPVRGRLYKLTGDKRDAQLFSAAAQLGNYFFIKDKAAESLSYDRERLLHAGYHDKNSLSHYYGIKILLTLGLPIAVFVICSTFFSLKSNQLLSYVCGGAIFGFIAPSFYLDKKVYKRIRTIRNAFPDMIDQLIVCTEAGLGLEASLQRVARDTALSNDVMSYELDLVNAELRAGVSREQVFKNLVNRTGVEDIRSFATAMTQSIRFGTSVGNTMRIFAEDLRDKRTQRAEEEAAKLAVKMLFPLGLCFFPGIMIVILGPAMINIYNAFMSHKF
jgi:tight adherence protein C